MVTATQTSVVIGASAGLGRALAERLAERGHSLFLVASDERDLAAAAADLRLRFRVPVTTLALDLGDCDPATLRAQSIASLGHINNLFYIAGYSTMDTGPREDEEVRRLVAINFTSAVRLVNVLLDDLIRSQHGNLVGVGSVAAIRGRKVNSIYGAAKCGLETYFAALRHYLAGKSCSVQFYRLGYLETQMTLGQNLAFPPLAPDAAAMVIVGNLGRDLGSVYLPPWWGLIAAVVRLTPWALFKRLER